MAKKSGGDESKNKITVGVVSKNNPFSSRRFVIFVVAVLIILVAAAVVILSLTHNKSNSLANQSQSFSKPQGPFGVVGAPPLTKEQTRQIEDTARVDGVVDSVNAQIIHLTLSDKKKLAVNVTNKTKYSSGKMMYPAQSNVVKAGQKAVLTYDSEGNKLMSIWVNYDE